MALGEEQHVKRLRERGGEIFPLYEIFYIESMLFNCKAAKAAILQIAELCGENAQVNEDDRATRILDEAQAFVLHAGALSRFFWPVRKDHGKRGEQLREAFGIANDSPLIDRSLRDGLEHFDERLDLYLCRDIVGYVFPQNVGDLEESSDVPVHHFRAFDPRTGTFELLGNRYALDPLVKEVLRVHERLLGFRSSGRFHREEAAPTRLAKARGSRSLRNDASGRV